MTLSRFDRILRIIAPTVYGIFIVFFVAFSFYHLRFAKKIIPGVFLGNISLGGDTSSQAYDAVKARMEKEIVLEFHYLDKIYYIRSVDFGFSYSGEETVKKAFNIGRSGNFIENNKVKIAGLFGKRQVIPEYQYDTDLLSKKIEALAGEIETAHNDSSFFIDATGALAIRKEQYGNVFDKESFKNAVLKSLDSLDFSPIYLEQFVYPYKPTVLFDDLKGVEDQYAKYIGNLPAFTLKGNFWPVSKSLFTEMVKPEWKNGALVFSVDKKVASNFLNKIAQEVDSPPKGEIFKLENSKVADFRLPTPGYSVKRDAAVEILSLALLDLSMERQIALPVETYLPSASNNSYGIKELLGEGYSKFEGSIPNRVQNIVLASKNINGVLIAPGEIFSFNKAVGPIDYAHGFTSAYIISKGRTVLGEGGGVCQVSTTLFRAALNAGLPILSRTAHAYRVSYYEQDSELGLDATVFQPTVDLTFKNDTGNYLLIQSEVLADQYKMYFRIYGTGDGRVSKITASKPLSQTPPPPPIYQDDPTLQKGITKQVDWSSWGATVEVTRTVEKDGHLLYNDLFKSYYQPWAAVYLVGTKE